MHPNDGRVVSNFIVQSLQGEDITIYGDGSQTRSFCFVDDMITGIMKMAATPAGTTGPINLGNPHEISIGQLAELIIELSNTSSKVIYQNLPENDPRRRQPCIQKAKEVLDWEPKIELKTGILKTIDYFNKELKII